MKSSLIIFMALLAFTCCIPTLKILFPFANVVNRVKFGQLVKFEINDCHPGWGEGIFPINSDSLKYFRLASGLELERWGVETETNELIGGQNTCTFYYKPHKLGKEKIYFQYVNKGEVGELYSVTVKAIKGDEEESEPFGTYKDEAYHYFHLKEANLSHRLNYDVKVGDIIAVDTTSSGSIGYSQSINKDKTDLTFISVLENTSTAFLIGAKTVETNYFLVQKSGDLVITISNSQIGGENDLVINIHADE